MSTFIVTVRVETSRESGKFASREEQEEAIVEALDGANPGQLDSLGADGDSTYVIDDWNVEVSS